MREADYRLPQNFKSYERYRPPLHGSGLSSIHPTQPMTAPQSDDYLALKPKRPPTLTWERAEVMRRPRRCNVTLHRQGGAICCELCLNQVFGGHPMQVGCAATEDPPLFRPRSREE
jgi:hypothetical protein